MRKDPYRLKRWADERMKIDDLPAFLEKFSLGLSLNKKARQIIPIRGQKTMSKHGSRSSRRRSSRKGSMSISSPKAERKTDDKDN